MATKKNEEIKVSLKGIRNKRQGEIYDYYRRQFYQEKNWGVLEDLSKSQRESIVGSLYKSVKLSREEHRNILKQTNRAYREEITEQQHQLKYWKSQIGSQKLNSPEFTKSDKFKYFWLEKGEHKEFRKRKKEFDTLWAEKVQQNKGKRVLNRKEVLKIYEELYRKSPWRIRDRFVIPTKHPPVIFNTGELYQKYIKNNPYSATRKYYMRAMINLVKNDQQTGEQVKESDLTIDRHGKVILQKGQSMIFEGDKPGKSWKVFKNVEPIEMRAKRLFHDFSHQNYIENEGSEFEKQIFSMKTNKSLCWIEYAGLGSCRLNQGTSAWFCLDCVNFGELHPPILPKHCPYLYTYKTWLCGQRQHPDANNQWHFSVQGAKTRDKIKGGDWGSCHIGTYSKPRKKGYRGGKKPL